MKNNIDLYSEWKQFCDQAEQKKNIAEGITFVYPADEQGRDRVPCGFDYINLSAFDAMDWYGFALILETKKDVCDISVTASFWDGRKLKKELYLTGEGRQDIFLSLKDFPYPQGKEDIWRELVSVTVAGDAVLESIRLIRRKKIAVSSPVYGKAVKAGETAQYSLTVGNCTSQRQCVEVTQTFVGWESFEAKVSESRFLLESDEEKTISVKVTLPQTVAVGGHEDTILRLIPDGDSDSGESITFSTLCEIGHPFIYHDLKGWAEVAERIERNEKFQKGYLQFKQDADSWEVTAPLPLHERDYCYDIRQENYFMSCAYMYSITKELAYAEKIAKFFRYFVNEEDGYPVKKKGCSQSYVQEGHFFQHLVLSYDMIYDADVLTKEEKNSVEKCFRIYMEILDRHIRSAHVSNWILSEVTGAIYCAMVLEDWERVKRFVYGNGGALFQLQHGTFTDGWWHECSVGYNIWVSSMYIHIAHALLAFGVNILYERFPVTYGKEVGISVHGEKPAVSFGMYNERWGGFEKNYITIKDLFDAPIPFLDYRGVLFGMNDSDEKKIEGAHFGSTYDLAYTYYKDPAYIPIIRHSDTIDPIFGLEELPEVENTSCRSNAYSDNIGIAMLRSHTPGREDREQIQAVLRYGSHGYAHGHFDRTELLSVMRYGRSFYNPEHCWWGYKHFMYKFYVQDSVTKNMVVVDEKMQVPRDSRRILFYNGKLLQAAAVTTTAPWSYPPFGGMRYDDYSSNETLEERTRFNASDLKSYDAAPYGELTEFTEPIVQTRAMAVLDDAIVLFDYLKGEQKHRYENLFQIKGFLNLESAEDGGLIRYTGHTGQKTTNVLSDAQFITDCSWYETEGVSVARFNTRFGEGSDMRGTRMGYCEPGDLHMDVYTAWPPKTVQCLGLVAEDHGIRIPYHAEITADGAVLEEITANAWLLGARRIDVSCAPTREMELHIENGPVYNEQKYPHQSKQGLFLGGACVEFEDGSTAPLSECELVFQNIDEGYGIGKDYEGGRVLIEGEEYADALPVSPLDHDAEGLICVKSIKPIVRLTGILGADSFPGPEQQRRRTYAIRQEGETAKYITVIEPYESNAVIGGVSAVDEDTVMISYADGRKDTLHISGMETGKIAISLIRKNDSGEVYHETTVTA